MKVKLTGYELSPHVTLFVTPETDAERVLLRTLWKFGRLEMCNGVADNSGEGFAVSVGVIKQPEAPRET